METLKQYAHPKVTSSHETVIHKIVKDLPKKTLNQP